MFMFPTSLDVFCWIQFGIYQTTFMENPVVFIPNAFTPDGDGYNDILRVEGTNITEMVFMIFDRWGQKVFETNDQSIGWDGSFKGKQVNPDSLGIMALSMRQWRIFTTKREYYTDPLIA